jgi:hypothetical protein
MRLPRSDSERPNMAYSSGRYPSPAMYATRPRLKMSRTAMSSASRTGSCSGTSSAATLIGTVAVRAAIAVASTMGAGR